MTSTFPRAVALAAILILGSATITFAAETQLRAKAPAAEAPVVTPPLLTVPDVRGQAYVFAKGTLEERGFAWRVTGSVQGYPANTVALQTPAAGTRVVDTGLPTVVLGLARNGRYAQEGSPENASPYAGTKIQLLVSRVRPKAQKPKAKKPARKQQPKRKAAPSSKPAAKPKLKPKAAPKLKPKAAPKPKPKAAPKPKPKAAPKPKPKAVPKPKPKSAAKPKPKIAPVSRTRPPAFAVAGAPKEPQREVSLPERARRLDAWLRTHTKPTDANVRHWLYQHEWIVTGARFGWWHGAEALEILITIDERVQRMWEIGGKSEAVARRTLATIKAKSR